MDDSRYQSATAHVAAAAGTSNSAITVQYKCSLQVFGASWVRTISANQHRSPRTVQTWGDHDLMRRRGGSGWPRLQVEKNRALIGHE